MRMMMTLAMFAMPAVAQAQGVLFDPRQPAEVATALRDAGYKAEMKAKENGDPFIQSAANGESFTINFYGCTAKIDCNSFEFFSWYKKEPLFTVAFANEWNASKRFISAAIDSDGDLALSMDVAAIGKMTKAAFADNVDWYQSMSAAMDKFIEEKRPPAAATPAAKK